jgi:hypothetical protein
LANHLPVAFLQATNRLEEAEPLMRRAAHVVTEYGEATGHEHRHLRDAIESYRGLLQAMNLNRAAIQAKVHEVQRSDASLR